MCGGHLSATSEAKTFYSHAKYGDSNYENREDCDWIIEAPYGKNVRVKFLSFELEDEQECSYDYVEIFAGYDDSGPSYERYCSVHVSLFFYLKLCFGL